MRFILPYFIIILVLIQLYLKKSDKNDKDKLAQFWENEQKANLVRKKDISGLDYITIDDSLPDIDSSPALSDIINTSEQAESIYYAMISLKDKKMLNLSGLSNTDLKMNYGVANLETLTQYEDNYTELIKYIAELGHILIEHEDFDDAQAYLEYGIRIGSDIRSNYYDLNQLYIRTSNTAGITSLKQHAELIKTLNHDTIVSMLQ